MDGDRNSLDGKKSMKHLIDEDALPTCEITPLIRKQESESTIVKVPPAVFEGDLAKRRSAYLQHLPLVKTALIGSVIFIFIIVLSVSSDDDDVSAEILSAKLNESIRRRIKSCNTHRIKATAIGAFTDKLPSSKTQNLSIVILNRNGTSRKQSWNLPLNYEFDTRTFLVTNTFDISLYRNDDVTAQITTTSKEVVSFGLKFICKKSSEHVQVTVAALILAGVYVLIIFELVHRALASMIGALVAVAMLAILDTRPNSETVIHWIDFETITLLFGMMILVGIFCESGFFDWVAFRAYNVAQGNAWKLITLLCLFTAGMSAFLDNVTSILLMAPVTIRLSEVLHLDPRQMLIFLVVFSNIGGTATAIGDPPNIIIVSNSELRRKGIRFANFTVHMTVGVVFIMVVCYIFMRFLYQRKKENATRPDITELKHEIEIWRRSAMSIAVASREESTVKESLLRKVEELEKLLHEKTATSFLFTESSEYHKGKPCDIEISNTHQIKDRKILIQGGIVLVCVILLFFISSLIPKPFLSLGTIAVFGALVLTVISGYDCESLLLKVEWATLMLYAGLFILMKALEELGLIQFIGDQIISCIRSVGPHAHLPVAIILILWISALASSFIDNVPFTTAMVPVLIQLSEDRTLNLPVHPLVWALAFGTCLGGNGTLIGATANLVCAGIADKHGYDFTFRPFFKIGFPIMLISTFTAMCYLLIVHCTQIAWNYW